MLKASEKKQEVIKHSAAIQISNEVNLLQRRSWNVLLANAFDDLPTKDQFEIPLKDLRTYLGYEKSHNNAYLKQRLRELMDIKIEWNVLGKDGADDWGAAVLLADARIINGNLIYGFSPALRRRLYNPEMYARINLSLQNEFGSKYGLAMYELCLDYFHVKSGKGETPYIRIEDFRRLMGLEEGEYTEFKRLNKDVINKSLKEINARSDLDVQAEYQREGRRVTAIKFVIRENHKYHPVQPLTAYPEPAQDSLPLAELEIDNQELFNILHSEFGIMRKKTMEILKTKDEFYLYEVINLIRANVEAGKIKNVPAYAVKAIEDDYRPLQANEKLTRQKAKKRHSYSLKDRTLVKKLMQEHEAHLEALAQTLADTLDPATRKQVEADLRKKLTQDTPNLSDRLLKSNIRISLIPHIKINLIPQAEKDFIAFAQKKGVTLEEQNGEFFVVAA